MTPQQYLQIKRALDKVIRVANAQIEAAETKAHKCPFPKHVRPAEPDDIFPGKIIWHKGGDDGDFWNVVEEPLRYGSDFKAYTADDGCRYGLKDAYVEVTG